MSFESDEVSGPGMNIRKQALTANDVHEQAHRWTLVSGPGQSFELPTDLRRSLALFAEGIAIVRIGLRQSAAISLSLRKAENAGLRISSIVEVSPDLINSIYAKNSREASRLGTREAIGDLSEDEEHVRKLDLDRQRSLARIIAAAARINASDIHIRVLDNETEVKYRVNGRMREATSVSANEGQEMIRAAFAVASGQGATGTDTTFQQGAMFQKSGLLPKKLEMLRLQYTPTADSRGALVMRLKYLGNNIDADVDSLGYSDEHTSDLKKMRLKTNGMYIFAGKVSSGKTTTLQRCLNAMYNEKRKEITIFAAEDPKELELPGAIQAQINAGGSSNDAFRLAMKAALRSDPNVIVLGEIRSEELTMMAIEAAKTGHALWSTVHAGSALGILNRLINLGADREDLKDPKTVGGLIYQRLLGVMCTKCRKTFREAMKAGDLDIELGQRFTSLVELDADSLFVRGRGCSECFMGLTGRTVVAETIRPDTQLLELYMNNNRLKAQQYWLAPRDEGGLGGFPVLHHALAKVGAGIVDLNEVEEEVDLVENYERENAHLVTKLRKDVALLRAKFVLTK